MKNKPILILKVSLSSPAYDVYYSIKEIFKSLQARLTIAPDFRHDAAKTIVKKKALAMFMLVNQVKNKQM